MNEPSKEHEEHTLFKQKRVRVWELGDNDISTHWRLVLIEKIGCLHFKVSKKKKEILLNLL